MKKLILALTLITSGWAAQAQEVGFLGGFQSTGADSKTTGLTVDAKINFRLGVPIAFELVENFKVNGVSGIVYHC